MLHELPIDIKQDHMMRTDLRIGAMLPHLVKDGSTYAITFRLADSLPKGLIASWQETVLSSSLIQIQIPRQRSLLPWNLRNGLIVVMANA